MTPLDTAPLTLLPEELRAALAQALKAQLVAQARRLYIQEEGVRLGVYRVEPEEHQGLRAYITQLDQLITALTQPE